jgi:hypothetical protein
MNPFPLVRPALAVTLLGAVSRPAAEAKSNPLEPGAN